jgi:hypothetical protein
LDYQWILFLIKTLMKVISKTATQGVTGITVT